MSVASAQMMASFVKLLLDQAQQQAKLREREKGRGRQLRRQKGIALAALRGQPGLWATTISLENHRTTRLHKA
jgi:hypothetical protein